MTTTTIADIRYDLRCMKDELTRLVRLANRMLEVGDYAATASRTDDDPADDCMPRRYEDVLDRMFDLQTDIDALKAVLAQKDRNGR